MSRSAELGSWLRLVELWAHLEPPLPTPSDQCTVMREKRAVMKSQQQRQRRVLEFGKAVTGDMAFVRNAHLPKQCRQHEQQH